MPGGMRRALAVPYKPANIYLREATLPPSLRRVAILPVPRSREDANQAAGAQLLEPIFIAEISKRNLFEVVRIPPESMQTPAEGNRWAAEDKLPQGFFERLHEATGCDAVIFVSLPTYQPYPPLRIGWKARLVDCGHQQTWWAVDEVFDGGANPVAAAAEAYARADLNLPDPLQADTGVLHSPRRFGLYTASAIAGTLPGR
jgi:hypothetical protein